MPRTFEDFVADPRGRPAPVVTRMMPACDGGEWPALGSADAVQRQQIEFLAAYYHLNRLYARLQQARHDEDCEWVEACVLADLQEAIAHRDRLEDLAAVVGFDAEPVLMGQWVTNVRFTYAGCRARENHRRGHPQEARVKVPRPSVDTNLEVDVEGIPGIPVETLLADLGLRLSTQSSITR